MNVITLDFSLDFYLFYLELFVNICVGDSSQKNALIDINNRKSGFPLERCQLTDRLCD